MRCYNRRQLEKGNYKAKGKKGETRKGNKNKNQKKKRKEKDLHSVFDTHFCDSSSAAPPCASAASTSKTKVKFVLRSSTP